MPILSDEEEALALSQEDEFVYVPCHYAEKVGMANGAGPCPRCGVPKFTFPFGEPRNREPKFVEGSPQAERVSMSARRYDVEWFRDLVRQSRRRCTLEDLEML